MPECKTKTSNTCETHCASTCQNLWCCERLALSEPRAPKLPHRGSWLPNTKWLRSPLHCSAKACPGCPPPEPAGQAWAQEVCCQSLAHPNPTCREAPPRPIAPPSCVRLSSCHPEQRPRRIGAKLAKAYCQRLVLPPRLQCTARTGSAGALGIPRRTAT